MALNFIKSSKGKNLLSLNGFIYTSDKVSEDRIYWKCENLKKNSGKGRAITSGETVIKENNLHNHSGDAAGIEARIVYGSMKQEAETGRDPCKIYGRKRQEANLTKTSFSS
ncbi:unnamed protein product [Brassicogethes aeneus]|uniref:FLYWCH-type domain-containing protein n=1 Tax=Brassicogethes aeneus TaxID=1431903 RepID=A0A9P0ATE0_BRAAE|nr:unnamed protein product [Brassicogethes aeneus]